jgi:hypothetical protein
MYLARLGNTLPGVPFLEDFVGRFVEEIVDAGGDIKGKAFNKV